MNTVQNKSTLTMIQTTCTLLRQYLYHRRLSTIAHNGLKTQMQMQMQMRKRATEKWFETIVIGEKLCPFAMATRKEPQLRIVTSSGSTHDDIVDEIASEAHLLMGGMNTSTSTSTSSTRQGQEEHQQPPPETTLVVLNEEKCPSLLNFRDLVHLSWQVQDECIVQNGYEKDLQIVLFHPLAVHNTYGYGNGNSNGNDDSDDYGDAADYTIRSPYPIIHLLREVDVMNAVKSGYKDLEGLPSRNKAKLRKLGLEVCKQRLDDCKQLL